MLNPIERISPAAKGELQVVFATDTDYASRVEVAAYSLLKNTSCPVRLVIIGTRDVADAFPRLRNTLPLYPAARLEMVFPCFLTKAALNHEHHFLPPAAFGRMLVPHMLRGRVLYLDGDTLVRHDMAEALKFDLNGKLAAASRDLIVMRHFLRVTRTSEFTKKRHLQAAKRAKRSLAPFQRAGCDVTRYFNSGVMILDCDALQDYPDILRDFLDYERARDFVTFDQDLINLLLADNMAELDATWNTWSGVAVTRHAPFNDEERAAFAQARRDPKIVHYYGETKPWNRWGYRHFARGLRWHRVYRRYETELNRLANQI